jgi:hypothetical protein
MMKIPFLLMVPPVTLALSVTSTGRGSAVIMDSSTEERPSVTIPSTGMLSPGRTLSRSPASTWSSGISSSDPSLPMRLAVFGGLAAI